MTIKKIVTSFLIVTTLSAIGKPPLGLTSVGASCFINATLQSFLSLDTLNQMVSAKKITYEPGSIAPFYIDFHQRVQRSTCALPYEVMFPLCVKGWSMLNQPLRTQQDAEQFLMGLLNHLIYRTNSVRNDHALGLAPHFDILELFNASTGTEIQYGGAVVSDRKIEPILPLALPIQGGDKTLDQCIQNYFALDKIEFKPDNLPASVICEKRITLEKTNQYLIITAKRGIGKPQAISFPLTNLTMRPYFQDQSKDKGTYDLKSIIMHSGGVNGGHYTSYVNINDIWYYCNDSIIRRLTPQEMATIAQRGYGENPTFIPTTFIYELSDLRRAAIRPEPVVAPMLAAAIRAAQPARQPAIRTAAIKRAVVMPKKAVAKKHIKVAQPVKKVTRPVQKAVPQRTHKAVTKKPATRRPVSITKKKVVHRRTKPTMKANKKLSAKRPMRAANKRH